MCCLFADEWEDERKGLSNISERGKQRSKNDDSPAQQLVDELGFLAVVLLQ